MQRGRPRRGFTLIEVLVVVAIIALLIAILLPSLKAARNTSRAAVCASNVRQITAGGIMWMQQVNKGRAPAHRGWAAFVLKELSGQNDLFVCPSDNDPLPIPAMYVEQFRASSGEKFPSASLDGAYYARSSLPIGGWYRAKMETDVEQAAGGDRDFDDATIENRPDSKLSPSGKIRASKGTTGRNLVLRDWKGKRIGEIGGDLPGEVRHPLLWGSYGMNLSSALPDAKPWQAIYLDYHDWSAVTEAQLWVRALTNTGALTGARQDDPRQWVARRHTDRANVGFLDTHVELVDIIKLRRPTVDRPNPLWHPLRPPGWIPPGYE